MTTKARTKTETKRPIWGAYINLGGISGPFKAYWDDSLRCWYDRSGNFDFSTIGVDPDDSVIRFSSESKHEVELWISGARSLIGVLNNSVLRGFRR